MSDNTTTIQELKDLTRTLVEQRDWDKYHTLKDMAMNAIIELSELLDHLRFKTEDEIIEHVSNANNKKELAKEFSDAFYSMLRISELLDIDMSEELRSKLKEIEEKYPIDKFKGSKKKYSEL